METEIRVGYHIQPGLAAVSTRQGLSPDPFAPRVVWAGPLRELPGVPNGCILWVSQTDFDQLKNYAPPSREEAP